MPTKSCRPDIFILRRLIKISSISLMTTGLFRPSISYQFWCINYSRKLANSVSHLFASCSEYCGFLNLFLVTQSCPTLCDPMDCSPPGSSVHGDSPGKNTRVGCHAFLQGIFPTQGSNPGLLHYRRILYHLSHQGLSFLFFSSVPLPKGLFYYLSLQKANSCFCWYPPFLYFLFSWFFLYHYYFLNFIWIYSVFILTY